MHEFRGGDMHKFKGVGDAGTVHSMCYHTDLGKDIGSSIRRCDSLPHALVDRSLNLFIGAFPLPDLGWRLWIWVLGSMVWA